MGEVVCRRCGEEFDEYYISHILPEKDRPAFRAGLYCPKCRSREEPSERDRELKLRSIAEIMYELSEKFIPLTLRLVPGKLNKRPLTPEEEYSLLEDYFVGCQIAESRIKDAWKSGILTYDKVHWINKEIGGDVSAIVSLSKSNRSLNTRMIQLVETEPFVTRILKAFTRPDVYEAFVYLNRKYRARAEPSESRTAEYKSR
jgi:hypothetical protein